MRYKQRFFFYLRWSSLGARAFQWTRQKSQGCGYWVAVISAKKPQAPIRNHQTRKVANAKGLDRNTNLTQPNLP